MPKAKAPCTEPEIIPDWPRASRIWVSTGPYHTTRIQITRPGPVGIALFVLLIGIMALAGMALLLGAALVAIAAGGALIVGGIISSLSICGCRSRSACGRRQSAASLASLAGLGPCENPRVAERFGFNPKKSGLTTLFQ